MSTTKQDYRRTILLSLVHLLSNYYKKITDYLWRWILKRDFVYVDDVNNFHLMYMMIRQITKYLILIWEKLSIKDIYEKIRLIIGSDITPLFEANFDFEAQENLANIDKAKKIGWNPKTNLSDGLKKSIDYIKENVI